MNQNIINILQSMAAHAGLAAANTPFEQEQYFKFCNEMDKLEEELAKLKLIPVSEKKSEKNKELARDFVRAINRKRLSQ